MAGPDDGSELAFLVMDFASGSEHPLKGYDVVELYLGGRKGSSVPVVTLISPVSLAFGSVSEPLVFDVTDESPGIELTRITIKYAGEIDTFDVHNGSVFLGQFASVGSSRVSITGGFRYTVVPVNGWSDAFTLTVQTIDGDGILLG